MRRGLPSVVQLCRYSSPRSVPVFTHNPKPFHFRSVSTWQFRREQEEQQQGTRWWVPPTSLALGSACLLSFSKVLAEEQKSEEETVEKEKPAETETKGNPDDIPKYDYVLIGGGIACFSALQAIRQNDKTGSVLIVGGEDHYPYERSALTKGLWFQENQKIPKEVSDKLVDIYKLAGADSRTMEKDFNCTFMKNDMVIKAWEDDRVLALGSRKLIRYGKVLIATGGAPDVPFDVTDNALPHVSTFQTLQDFNDLKTVADHGKSITVIGGGLTGCELVTVLSSHKAKNDTKPQIQHLIKEEYLLEKYIPRFLAEYVTENLRRDGIIVKTNQNVKLIRKDENDNSGTENTVNVGQQAEVAGTVQIVLENGEILESDYVIVAAGNTPSTEIGNEMNLEVDPLRGGIVCNSQLQAINGVYVAGDVASYYDRVLGKRRRNEYSENAVFQGQVAGHNMSLQTPDLTNAKTQKEIEKKISKASPRHYLYQPIYSSIIGDNWFHAVGMIDPKAHKVVAVFDKGEGGESETNKRYKRGVLYYLNEELDDQGAVTHRLVGILLWNVSRIRLAQRTLKSQPRIRNRNDLLTLIPLEESKPIPPFDFEKEMEEEAAKAAEGK